MASPSVKHISESFIQPHYASEVSKQPFYLTPTDLAMLSAHYIQKGLLFKKPLHQTNNPNFIDTLLAKLKHSLSLALVHFYPLAGRLVTKKEQDPHLYLVYVDCTNSPGAKFIHASLDMSVSDIVSPTDVPLVVQSFFDHDRAINHDGHTTSLLTAQVTELVDGVFIGLSMNHCLGDGTSYWNFFNTWSEIYQAQEKNITLTEISNPPVMDRWFPEGHGPIISLPFTDPSEFIDKFEAPKLRERMFHFSSKFLAKLKAKANSECESSKISTFQSLSALLWRTITRARVLPADQETTCRLAANNRARLDPPLPSNYFGNSIYPIQSEPIKAGELLDHGLGWAAWRLHQAVLNLTDQELKRFLDGWLKSPVVFSIQFFDPFSVMMGSSPRFDMYRNEFGMGKAVALRSGYANKFGGKVSSFQGREPGSIDLEVCLPPEVMRTLESDDEFMEVASVPSYDQSSYLSMLVIDTLYLVNLLYINLKSMASPNVKRISECFIQPHSVSEESKQPCYLNPTDLAMLAANYVQKGLLFTKPPQSNNPKFIDTLLAKLKHSLSLALVHFYPLAGRLATKKEEDPHLYLVYVDCTNSPGAKFIHASLDMSVSDILSPTDVPLVVQSFFDHDRELNHDGHTTSLLTAQVTELKDGVFIGLSMNHSLGDGTSYWNFFNTWSEIFQAQEKNVSPTEISNPPMLQRWFPEGRGPIISLPFTDPSEFVDRFEAPKLRERMFHFCSESLAKLKAKANTECETSKISTFQSLSALLWRTITRARSLPPDKETSCRLAANCRARLDPALPTNYFGNSVYPIRSEVIKAGELLDHGLGWSAWKVHQAVVALDNQALRGYADDWFKSPMVFSMRYFDPYCVMMGSSPRFDMYRNEFGMGKAVALRSGYANKFSGKVSAFQGREPGSIDLEVCLTADVMRALESDDEFMEAAFVSSYDRLS
ncbi:uncharacterized protein LOC126784279 [Argentina anserina]|uniref:uncharacterized protein LOC126784279 n=1 Tax=Argentina anserina TaxID=57926 RepID=UPI002176693C|nr:uncharacterized protein LOC126784279 [Potentilla anserina]